MKKNIIRWMAALLLIALPALALAAEFAVVRGGRLNLRAYPDANSASLGKYATGSWVRLDRSSGSWWYVRTMDGKSGYMSASYLDTGAAQNQGTVLYANGGYVNLRSGPSLSHGVVMRVTSGSDVYIKNNSGEWYYVYVYSGGQPVYGYMHRSFISTGVTTATVTTRNGGRVNLRSGPDSSYSSVTSLSTGTVVSVLLKGSGWYKVSVNGYTGYMSTQYLTAGGSLGSGTGSGITSSTIAYVNNPRDTQVLNLREQPSQSARSIGQYRNGTRVKVVSRGSTWCEVYVGTRHGYMMTRYLSFSYVPSYGSGADSMLEDHMPLWGYSREDNTPGVAIVTPAPIVEVAGKPQSGDYVTLEIPAGSYEKKVAVYNDIGLTSLKTSVFSGEQVMMLKYDKDVCMIYVSGGVGYVPTVNVAY